ncbi:uncharacterized protein PSANT_00686 [Moesziomyces antarcticus]|uniref:Uncharacterized protein n=1 Tax=Pseudozyma antarctica TaxID=84753 RepID=A0A5C3FF03_PSEA2|nr:uncharacterized protein PSANT_00686 [Moesziomyces antarcticus]
MAPGSVGDVTSAQVPIDFRSSQGPTTAPIYYLPRPSYAPKPVHGGLPKCEQIIVGKRTQRRGHSEPCASSDPRRFGNSAGRSQLLGYSPGSVRSEQPLRGDGADDAEHLALTDHGHASVPLQSCHWLGFIFLDPQLRMLSRSCTASSTDITSATSKDQWRPLEGLDVQD